MARQGRPANRNGPKTLPIMQKLIEFILNSIVDKPEDVEISEKETESGVINYLVKVHPDDMGKVIGRGGQIIRAIRTLLKVKAVKDKKRVFFTLQED